MSSRKNDSSGSIAPKERVNIKFQPKTGNQTAEVELPLNLLVTGNLTGGADDIRWTNASRLLLIVTILTPYWTRRVLGVILRCPLRSVKPLMHVCASI